MLSAYHIDTYDFVAEKNGRFMRVNVKLASGDKRADRPNASPTISKSRKNSGDPDLYLVYLPKQKQFVEVDGAFLSKVSSRRVRPQYYISLL